MPVDRAPRRLPEYNCSTVRTREGSLRYDRCLNRSFTPVFENRVKMSDARDFFLFFFGAARPAVPSWYRPSPGRNY